MDNLSRDDRHDRPKRKPAVIRAAAVVAALFGVLTVLSGASVLFGEGGAAAGDYVPYIVWFNFLAGFAYVAAAAGLWRRRRWGVAMALALAALNALFFAALGGHIASGAPYEMRTVAAMALRTGFWAAVAAVACEKGVRTLFLRLR